MKLSTIHATSLKIAALLMTTVALAPHGHATGDGSNNAQASNLPICHRTESGFRLIHVNEHSKHRHINNHDDLPAIGHYQDADGDGFGVGEILSFCPAPGLVTLGSDCDDGDTTRNPAALEICGDGIDNNCDGFTDGEDALSCPPAAASAVCGFFTQRDAEFFVEHNLVSLQCVPPGGPCPLPSNAYRFDPSSQIGGTTQIRIRGSFSRPPDVRFNGSMQLNREVVHFEGNGILSTGGPYSPYQMDCQRYTARGDFRYSDGTHGGLKESKLWRGGNYGTDPHLTNSFVSPLYEIAPASDWAFPEDWDREFQACLGLINDARVNAGLAPLEPRYPDCIPPAGP